MKTVTQISRTAVLLIFAMLLWTFPSLAQQISGQPVSPSATETIDGKQLPPPDDPAAGLEELETATVPLKIVNIGDDESHKEYKVGIELRLGGGELRLYTFDTGSSGFYAARNRDWWPSFEPVRGPKIEQSYGDETTFRARIVRTTVAIPTNLGELQAEVEVGQIMNAWGGALGPRGKSTWRKYVKVGAPPLFGKFFGDFGSGLTERNGLFAVLPQLSGNLSSGFALRLGCIGIPSSTPTLQIGLTEAIRSQVTSWVPMQGGDQSPPFPNSGLPTYGQKLLEGHFSLEGDGPPYQFRAGTILDTGGGTTSLHEHGDELKVPDALLSPNDQNVVLSDVLFRVTAEGTEVDNGFDLEFTTGTVPTCNEIDVTQSDDEAYVNLGLIPFFRYDVVFDVERGLVGFAPCTAPLPACPSCD
jgi:hypothetical protein